MPFSWPWQRVATTDPSDVHIALSDVVYGESTVEKSGENISESVKSKIQKLLGHIENGKNLEEIEELKNEPTCYWEPMEQILTAPIVPSTTLLNVLLEKGSLQNCKFLLEKHLKERDFHRLFREKRKETRALLFHAASNSSSNILRYLLEEREVFPKKKDDKGNNVIDEKYIGYQNEEKNTLLHYACSYGKKECVEWLLKNNAKHHIKNKKNELPLHWAAAAKNDEPEKFEMIYELYAKEDYVKKHKSILEKEWEDLTPGDKKYIETSKKLGEDCLKLEANKLGVPVLFAAKSLNCKIVQTIFDHQIEADGTPRDEDCDTILHFVSRKADIKQLSGILKANALLGTRNKVGNIPLDWLGKKNMKNLLDEQLTTKDLEEQKSDVSRKDSYEILINNKFGHHASGSDVKNILALANSAKHQSLSLHPVCVSILSAKWQKMRKYFYLKLLFFIPFVILLSLYPVLLNDKEYTDRNATEIEYEIGVTWYSLYTLLTIQVFFGSLSVIVLIKPFYSETKSILTKLNKQRFKLLLQYYYTELIWSDWYEYTLWILAFLLLHSKISPIPVAIVSWFSLFLVFSKHPAILPYRFILVYILGRYIKFFAFAFGLISGFAMGFYLLLRGCKEANGTPCAAGAFQSIYSTALKVPAMMMGEINFESMQLEQPYVYLLFGSFIFLITCCLFNMMNGLAIDITRGVMKKSYIFRTIAQAEMIYEFEVLLKEVSILMTKIGFKKRRIFSPLWVEMLKVSPSTGICKNLEEYYDDVHGLKTKYSNEDIWENYAGGNTWVWVDRGYSLNMKLIYKANKIIEKRNKINQNKLGKNIKGGGGFI